MKKLTKVLIGVLLAATALFSVATITACNEKHVHSWADDFTVDTPATCTVDGSKSIHCSGCDETKDATAIPAGHVWAEDFTVDTPATCTVAGLKSKHCTVDGCNGKSEVTAIPAAHSWAEDFTIDKTATCTVDGSKSIHCSGCDETKVVTVIPASGHSWAADFTVDSVAGCTVNGSKSIHCNGCTETKEVTVIPAAHKWADDFTVDTPAGCTTDGSKSKHCTVDDCDGKSEITVIPAGHKWADDFTVDTPAGCTTDGSKSIHCTVDGCDGKSEITVIPAGHKWADDFTIDTPATCTTDGSKSIHCTVDGCDGVKEVTVIPASGHSWADGYTVDIPATCTDAGSQSIHCNNCEETKDAQIIPAGDGEHDYDTEWTVDLLPDCQNEGVKSHHCKKCSDKIDETPIAVDPAAHKWAEDFTVDTPAGCTTDGSKSIHCTVEGCAETKEVTTIPAAHKWADDFTVDTPATCTEDGSKSKHCTVDGCDATTEATAVPANGHSWAEEFTVDATATCTEAGSKSKHCTVEGCDGKNEVTAIATVAHTYDSWDSVQYQKASTCTADGYIAHNICMVCHTKFDVNDTALANPISDEDWAANYVIPAAHTSVTKRAVKDPTCTLDGYNTEHYYCTKCKSYALDQAFTQPITAEQANGFIVAKLGHDYSEEWTIDKEATCSVAGSKSHHCTRCTTGKTGVTVIDKLPHSWSSEYTVDLAPTCQAVGSKTYHCTECDTADETSEVEIPISPDSHAWSVRSFILTHATCQAAGTQAKHCLLCDAQQEITVIPVDSNAHSPATLWTVDTAPTCTTAGSKSHHCTVVGCDALCDETEIPALGHNYVWSFDGLNGTSACANDGCDSANGSYTLPEEAEGKTVNNVVEANVASGEFPIYLGNNFVDVTQQAHRLNFTAEESGTYLFNFEYISNETQVVSGSLMKGATNVTNQGERVFTTASTRSNIVSIKINVYKGETLTLVLTANVNKYAKYIVKAELETEIVDKSLSYGSNTIKVTVSGDVEGIDSYTFTPDKTKTYSITVPENLGVIMNDKDLVSGGTYAEFEATKGTAITFSFVHSVIGEYEIVIGEAAPKVLELDADPVQIAIEGKTMTTYLVSDDLAPGKYTLTFSGNFLMVKSGGSGKLWLQINGSKDFDSLPDNYLPTDNAVYIQYQSNPINTDYFECDLNSFSNGGVWKVTLELAAGDIIYFAPDKSVGEGSSVSTTLKVQLTKAE